METNGVARRITTHEASIKTATVEVKALTISGKQVTQSVFRQLQEEDLLNPETGQLNGVPWGRVNYYWGRCEPSHLHVVWQKGGELRRSCVFESFRDRQRVASLSDVYLRQVVHPLLATARRIEVLRFMRAVLDDKICRQEELVKRSFVFLGRSCDLFDDFDGEWTLLNDYLEAKRIWNLKQEAPARKAKIQTYLDLNDYSPEDLSEFKRQVSEFESQWQETYTAVASTEQLFIAV